MKLNDIIEICNDYVCKIVSKLLRPFGYNKFTYKIFSFFFGFGYKYSFGSIRLKDKDDYLYIEFMPWYFANKNKVQKNIYSKIMLYGANDFLKLILFFKGKKNVIIKSHSNREIAFLINKKLKFNFKKYNSLKEAITLSDSNIFELYISTDDLVLLEEKIKKHISILKNFEIRN